MSFQNRVRSIATYASAVCSLLSLVLCEAGCQQKNLSSEGPSPTATPVRSNSAASLSGVLQNPAEMNAGAEGKESSSSDRIWVGAPDGSTSCEEKQGDAGLVAGAQQLEKAGVQVLSSKKANDGKMRAAVCGQESGEYNTYLIRASDLEKAKSKGFSRWPAE